MPHGRSASDMPTPKLLMGGRCCETTPQRRQALKRRGYRDSAVTGLHVADSRPEVRPVPRSASRAIRRGASSTPPSEDMHLPPRRCGRRSRRQSRPPRAPPTPSAGCGPDSRCCASENQMRFWILSRFGALPTHTCAGRQAPHGIDAGFDLDFLVGGNRCLAVCVLHCLHLFAVEARLTSTGLGWEDKRKGPRMARPFLPIRDDVPPAYSRPSVSMAGSPFHTFARSSAAFCSAAASPFALAASLMP